MSQRIMKQSNASRLIAVSSKPDQQESAVAKLSQSSSLRTAIKSSMMKKSKLSQQLTMAAQLNARHCVLVLALISTIQLLALTGHQRAFVVCQDFEDLNKQQASSNNQLPPHHTFQPLNRQSQMQPQQQQQNAPSPLPNNNRLPIQRPNKANRFSPSYSASSQLLAAQASSSATVISGPPSSMSSPAAAASQSGSGSVSNIEQLMKNALARTAQMNSAAAEPRQDSAPPAALVAPEAPEVAPILAQRSGQQKASEQVTKEVEKQATESETSPDTLGAEDGDKQTTASQTNTNGHDTVYSDQRFANLFARRGSNKKSRITPSEPIKAKPTLPSFIKSLPDPKQFTATQSANQDRAATPSGSSSFASQRLQQQNQNRLSLANQQAKKAAAAAITSTSAAIANNKRANALNGKPSSPTSSPKASASLSSNQKPSVATGKPAATISSNNPFNRSQVSSNDPANVIALARKRLLTNNALETAKLKQQQQQQQQTKPSTS